MQKIKFIFIYPVLVMILSTIILNCSDENNIVTPVPVDSSDFRYPFTDGSTWNYTITLSASDIKPDSIRHYIEEFYPSTMTGTATIMYDTVINSVVTKCFLDEFTSNGIARSNRYYYLNNDTALVLYARRQPHPASGILPLSLKRNNFTESDNYNLNEYTNDLQIMSDSLYSTLKYPMNTGTEWSYVTNGFITITTTKKYLGFENINVPAGTISCMKENIVNSYAPEWKYNNYYSRFGLIKNYTFIDDLAHTTSNKSSR